MILLNKLKNTMFQTILYISTILVTSISFNIAAYPSKTHCAKKEMSDKHKAEIRLRVHYDKKGKTFSTTSYGTHDSTSPKSKSSQANYEDPGSNNTYCYPVKYFNNNLTDVEKLRDFRIDVKHAGDCKKWDLSTQQNNVPRHIDAQGNVQQTILLVDQYYYDNSTQTYALRHYHFGVHTHCKLRAQLKPTITN